MIRSVAELKDMYKGQIIFVIGSGPSIDAYPPSFFKDKILVGANKVYQRVDVNFSVFTSKPRIEMALGETKCVCSDVDPDPLGSTPNIFDGSNQDYWVFKFGKYCAFEENLNDVGKDDTFCLGNSIALSCMNFAAHLGAWTIIMVGFDCCAVNGRLNYSGYNPEDYISKHIQNGVIEPFRLHKNDFFVRNSKEILLMSQKIKEVYGCDVAYLSPYVGLKNHAVLLKDYLTARDIEAMKI